MNRAREGGVCACAVARLFARVGQLKPQVVIARAQLGRARKLYDGVFRLSRCGERAGVCEVRLGVRVAQTDGPRSRLRLLVRRAVGGPHARETRTPRSPRAADEDEQTRARQRAARVLHAAPAVEIA